MTERFENWLHASAREQTYPATPDLTAALRETWQPISTHRTAGQRWALAFAVLLALALSSLLVPAVRASVLEWLQIGGVTIIPPQDARPTVPIPTREPEPRDAVSGQALSGRTTLAAARLDFQHPIRFPPSMGEPQFVYLQDFGTGPFVVLIWVDANSPDQAVLVQYILGPHTFLTKGPVPVVQESSVHGTLAIWTDGPYSVNLQGNHQAADLIGDHALIWERNGLTYRLELDGTLEEAVALAESIP
jgi:hypothetical protein